VHCIFVSKNFLSIFFLEQLTLWHILDMHIHKKEEFLSCRRRCLRRCLPKTFMSKITSLEMSALNVDVKEDVLENISLEMWTLFTMLRWTLVVGVSISVFVFFCFHDVRA